MREGFSYGANDIRDGVSLSQERRKTPVVMDTEFMNLYDLEAYLKLPGNFPVAKLKFTYKKREEIAESLVERAIQDLLFEENDPESTEKNTESSEKPKGTETQKPQETKEVTPEETTTTASFETEEFFQY
jgi:type IV secretory pathway TraG/TraD family ATPase VirD4